MRAAAMSVSGLYMVTNSLRLRGNFRPFIRRAEGPAWAAG